jgi:hypothetical protein
MTGKSAAAQRDNDFPDDGSKKVAVAPSRRYNAHNPAAQRLT